MGHQGLEPLSTVLGLKNLPLSGFPSISGIGTISLSKRTCPCGQRSGEVTALWPAAVRGAGAARGSDEGQRSEASSAPCQLWGRATCGQCSFCACGTEVTKTAPTACRPCGGARLEGRLPHTGTKEIVCQTDADALSFRGGLSTMRSNFSRRDHQRSSPRRSAAADAGRAAGTRGSHALCEGRCQGEVSQNAPRSAGLNLPQK